MKKTKREEISIDLLFKKHLKQFLDRLGKYDKFINKEILCEKCNQAVSWNNLGLIVLKNGRVKFFCTNPDCTRESL